MLDCWNKANINLNNNSNSQHKIYRCKHLVFITNNKVNSNKTNHLVQHIVCYIKFTQ